MPVLLDYPEIQTTYKDRLAEERGQALKLALSHLKPFAAWYEGGRWRSVSVLGAASIYGRIHGLPRRFAVEQMLCQLYEQKARSEVHPYPGHTSPTRKVFSFLMPIKRALQPARSFA